MAEIIIDQFAMAKVEGRKPRLPAYIVKMIMEMSK